MKQKPRDYYKQAIEIVANEPDWKKLCITIAQNNPKVFCAAADTTSPSLKNCVMAEYVSQGFVSAIKMYRNETGEALRESKHYVESVCSHLQPGDRG